MASVAPAARVEDPFGHSSAMNGVIVGLAVGALIGTAILTGGVSLIAVGAAVAITGGAGMAGQAIGQTIPGPDTGVIAIGSPNVAIDRRPAAMTVLATGPCSKDSGPPVPVATGAKTVRINNQLAARVGETMACSAVIRRGSAGVFIGGPSETVIKPTPEVPVWLENTMLAMAIGGTAIGTLGVGLTYGAGAAVGSLVGGMAGGHVGGQAASAGAAALGYGATGQAIAGVAGGMLGGALGGGAGFKYGMSGKPAVPGALSVPIGAQTRVNATTTDNIPGIGPVKQPVYRVDQRAPGTIFDEGFQPRGSAADLEIYVNTNQPSIYVSTSKTSDIAYNPDFAKAGSHLYDIDGRGLKGVDVNKVYPTNPFARESEIAIPGGIPRESVRSSRPILPDGTLGETIPNPYYKVFP